MWKGKMQPRRPSVSAPATEKDRSLARKKLNSEENMPDRENVASTPAVSAVVINGDALSPQQLQESASNYGVTPPPGRYWYDTISGMWGYEGGRRLDLFAPDTHLARFPPANNNSLVNAYVINADGSLPPCATNPTPADPPFTPVHMATLQISEPRTSLYG